MVERRGARFCSVSDVPWPGCTSLIGPRTELSMGELPGPVVWPSMLPASMPAPMVF